MKESGHPIFIKAIISISALRQSVADVFFVARLDKKLQRLLNSYIEYKIKTAEESVAQYNSAREHINDIISVSELLEELHHLKIGNAHPLLVSQDHLLRYKLLLLKKFNIKPEPVKGAVSEVKAPEISPTKSPARSSRRSSAQSGRTQSEHLSPTAEKIFKFIKESPHSRTKDIVDKFSALSERTVKRGLKDLSHQGLLKKESENRAVYYTAT